MVKIKSKVFSKYEVWLKIVAYFGCSIEINTLSAEFLSDLTTGISSGNQFIDRNNYFYLKSAVDFMWCVGA